MSQQLKIILGSKSERLDADTVIATLENVLDVLRTLERDFPVPDDKIHWEVVRATMRSPLTLTLEPRATGARATRMGEKIASVCVAGLRVLEREATTPPHFDDDTLEAAKALASLVRDKRSKLTLTVPNEPSAVPTEMTIRHVTEIEAKARIYIDYTTVEGKLEEVSVHNTDHVNLWGRKKGQRALWNKLSMNVPLCFPSRPDQFPKR